MLMCSMVSLENRFDGRISEFQKLFTKEINQDFVL